MRIDAVVSSPCGLMHTLAQRVHVPSWLQSVSTMHAVPQGPPRRHLDKNGSQYEHVNVSQLLLFPGMHCFVLHTPGAHWPLVQAVQPPVLLLQSVSTLQRLPHCDPGWHSPPLHNPHPVIGSLQSNVVLHGAPQGTLHVLLMQMLQVLLPVWSQSASVPHVAPHPPPFAQVLVT